MLTQEVKQGNQNLEEAKQQLERQCSLHCGRVLEVTIQPGLAKALMPHLWLFRIVCSLPQCKSHSLRVERRSKFQADAAWTATCAMLVLLV